MVEKDQSSSLGAELSALGSAPLVVIGDVPATAVVEVPQAPPAVPAPAISTDEQTTAVAVIASAPARERKVPALLGRRATLPPLPPDALAAALLLARRPTLAKTARSQSLPPDLITLIRIAAGTPETLRRAVQVTGKDPTFIRAAAVFYLEEVLGTEGGDDYRTLGLTPDASFDDIAEHTRWLTRWLLPHLGREDPEAAHLDRVLAAWSRLKTPEGRLAAVRMTTKRDAENDNSIGAPAGLPRWQVAAIAAVSIVAIGVLAMSGRLSSPLGGFASNAQEPASTATTEAGPAQDAN